MARNRKRKRSGPNSGPSKKVGDSSVEQGSASPKSSGNKATHKNTSNQNNSSSRKVGGKKNNRSRSSSKQKGTSSNKPSSQSKGRDNSRMRGRFDLPQDEFDKMYRARVDSPLDPALAISTARNFEPDRGPIAPKKRGILFAETIADALKIAESNSSLIEEVEVLHISIFAEGSREIPELTSMGKVFVGNAWATVLQRRVDDEWYYKVISPSKVSA